VKKLVLNIPNCETDNLFLKSVMQPSVGMSSSGRFSMIHGNQDQLLELTSQPDTLLINATSFASDIPEAFDSEGNPYDVFVAYGEDESRPNDDVLSRVEDRFRNFNVGINPSFIKNIAGAAGCPSLTIALNRKLYMHEKERTIIQSSYKLMFFFNDLYLSVLAANKNCVGCQ